MYNKTDQNYLTKLINDQYGLEFSLTPEISYSILPKPHFQIKDVVIFHNNNNFQKKRQYIGIVQAKIVLVKFYL